jgi:phosphoesterase RecJ-like protein
VSDQMARAADVLSGAKEVTLACHVNPDTDALGSMLGLSIVLRSRGAHTVCSFANEPFEVPRWAGVLAGTDALIPPATFPKEPEVMVTCDAASLDRLGSLGANAARARELIWIDHHVSNEGLGTIPLIDPSASSTCEMVFRLVRAMGGDLPDEAATCLYAGLVTDTGRFQYASVRPETLRLAAELREHRFDHARVAQALYDDNATAYLKVLGVALHRMRLSEAADLAWTYLIQADLAAAGVHPSETDDLIDVVRTARETDVAAVMKQQRDGRFRVSLRSRGGHDVSKVASMFGGGGHRLASGYTSNHGLAGTVERLEAALRGEPAEP